MIDNLAILISTILTVFAIYRAVKLDATRPWFREPPPPGATAKSTRPWKR